MNNQIKKIKFFKKIFNSIIIDSNELNIAVSCVNEKCDSLKKCKKKLAIKLDDGQWHCWVCNISGKSIISLFKYWLPKYTTEAAELFNYKYKINIDDKETKLELPDDFCFLNESKKYDFNAKRIKEYLKTRGISKYEINRYRLGYSNKPEYLNRIIIPSFDITGNLNYIVTRTIFNKKYPQYINCDIKKETIIFNNIDINWDKPIILVEGPFDSMLNIDNCIPLLGSTLSNKSKLFYSLIQNTKECYIALDYDAFKKMNKIAKLLYEYDINVKIIPLYKGEDPSELGTNKFLNRKKKAYNWSPNQHLISRINLL